MASRAVRVHRGTHAERDCHDEPTSRRFALPRGDWAGRALPSNSVPRRTRTHDPAAVAAPRGDNGPSAGATARCSMTWKTRLTPRHGRMRTPVRLAIYARYLRFLFWEFRWPLGVFWSLVFLGGLVLHHTYHR